MDLQQSGTDFFSQELMQKAIDTLAKVKEEVAIYQPQEWSGIATAASRQAKNAQELYDKIWEQLGIKITIIPQEEEGRIGFETAIGVTDYLREELVAYDSGSGSFQLTTELNGELTTVGGQFGYVAALEGLVETIRKQKLDDKVSPNPISIKEAKKLVKILQPKMPEISKAMARKFKKGRVVGIGTQFFIFAYAAQGIGKNTYTKEELWHEIEKHSGLTDEQLLQTFAGRESMVGMILLYSVMDALGIEQLTYAPANGSTEGLLIDANYWNLAPAIK